MNFEGHSLTHEFPLDSPLYVFLSSQCGEIDSGKPRIRKMPLLLWEDLEVEGKL